MSHSFAFPFHSIARSLLHQHRQRQFHRPSAPSHSHCFERPAPRAFVRSFVRSVARSFARSFVRGVRLAVFGRPIRAICGAECSVRRQCSAVQCSATLSSVASAPPRLISSVACQMVSRSLWRTRSFRMDCSRRTLSFAMLPSLSPPLWWPFFPVFSRQL